ncbi:MAG: response regulator [Coleofasciculus sp. B1-GNL1-01]|uniref:response regulator n=1 Tax=Coleofasciculus sp. B1-GNL1-01 TaxID=3068484 RepID=UPI0032F50B48
MQSEQQQRIMGYFMEEAQDHLNTIEQGLLNLQSTIEDAETLNEMFRAAHSVKGGAAMLGLNSIHQTAHRLEDYFKVLQETPIQVDTQLETLLLRVFDTLSALLNQLQSYGLTEETASTIMSDAEPVFEQLNSYLQQLAQNTQTAGDTPSPANSSQSSSKGTKTLPATFKRDVLVELREMLQLYKQSDTPEHRRALQDHCQRLIELGDRLDLPGWGELLEISKRAIANPENTYRLLASVTIKEIKQAQELVLTGRSVEIVPSEQLKALAPDATTVESTTASDSSTHSSPQPTPTTEESNQNQKETTHLPDSRDTYIQAEDTYIQDPNDTAGFRGDQLQFSTVQSSNSISPLSDQGEPEVGIAELNSLADIFETQTPDLDQTWQEEEAVINLNDKSLNSDSDDFLDLEDSNDFSDLIGESEQENSTADDLLMQGLDDDFAPDAIANPQASKESSDSLDISSSLTDDFSDLLFESDSSEDSDQMSHSDDDLNGLFGESFFDEEGEAASAEILSHSELEDLDVEEDFPQSSLQGDEKVSESDWDFDDLLEISSTEENPQTLGESVNQDDLDLEDYLESNDLDLENQLDNNNQAETIDIESATPEVGDVLNPFEETSLDDFDQEAWEDSEDLPDFEALNDFFDSEPGVESTPVDSLTEPENDSIVELPTSTDEALLNETTSSAQKDGDSSESLFEEQGDEILPEVTEDAAEFFAEEDEESQGSTAQVEDFDIDWLTDESQETQQPWTSETESAADLFGDWETPQAPSNEDLDDLFAEDGEESFDSNAQVEDLEADWLTDESPETPQPETLDTAADLFGDWETTETPSSENLDDLFGEQEEEALAESAEPEDLEADWLTDESVETPQPETSDSAADLFGDEEIPETAPSEDLDDLFGEQEEEALAESAQPEDLEADWLTDESVETPQPETSDTQTDIWGEWETPETASSEDLDDLFGEQEEEALAESAEPEDLEADWLIDESVETPQPETSDSAADLFGDWDIPETPSDEDLDDLFAAEEEAEVAPSAELEDLDEDWLTDESVETPQPETSDSAADVFGDWDIPETPSDQDLDALFSLEEATVDDDFSLATLAETEWDLDSPRESADEFADLETMLDGETSAALTSESGDEFADLETMLDGETSAALTSESGDEFADLEAMLDGETPAALTSESGDEFADLEAMLSDTPSQTESFEDLEILLGDQETTQEVAQTPQSQTKDDLDIDKELEILLQDADKTMGGSATTTTTGSRQTAPLPSRRPPRIFEQTMRVPVKHLDSLNNLVGELVVSRNSLEQDQERLRQFLDNLQHQVSALSDVGARMRDLYERSLLESSLLASSQSQQRSRSIFGSENAAPASQESDSESSEDYHPLEMDRFTGFHLLSQEMIELIVQVRESASDVEFLVDETDQVARNLRQVTTQLQEGLTRSRMVPFANAADRLTRPVREISIKLSKEAQLQVDGRETLLDKMILEHLYDPLTHLVNNAITHGIESPDERQDMGKPAVGQISLRAFHQGNQTVIAISDDGAGIDPERIKRKAIEKKLITPGEAKDLTNTELYDFLFHPGFSTKDEASEFAGRGVGMDVVRTSLSEIRGAIYIDSALGKGTTFTIRLPLTLSICKALCCLSDRARIAFPMDGVEDMFDVPQDRLQKDANGQVGVSWRDTLVSVQPLSELLSYNRSISRGNVYGGKREDDLVSIVVLRSSGTFIAIEVDQVLGEQEIVIKQLEGPPPKPIGIAGATVLGDGRIMPIADVLELIDLASGRLRKDSVTIWSRGDSEGAGIEQAPETPHEPLVLIVDDSITVRELLSMTFAKAGYRVEQSRDGQEAWDKLRSGLPCDIVFCDIEMPRMDGLELLSRLQKDENLSQLPIAMLTSRGAKRHRQMAAQLGASGYFTKPYLEEVLLDAAQRMIQGEVLFSGSEA